MLPLSPEPMRSSTGNSIESVEQPCGKPHDAMMSQVYPLSVVSSMVSSTVRAADNYSNNINTNTPAICKSANVGSIPARTSSLTK
jgi:hypothetical protein